MKKLLEMRELFVLALIIIAILCGCKDRTENNLSEALQFKTEEVNPAIKDARKCYAKMADPAYSIESVEFNAKIIREYVANGITWTELRFTDEDVEARLNAAKKR